MNLRVPVRKLRKLDLVWLGENFCRHGHTYLEHYSCFLSEAPDTAPLTEKIGMLDIESTGLQANWGFMVSWCIKEYGKPIIHEGLVTRKEIQSNQQDKRIIQSCVEEMKKYDRLVTWYGSGFDLPYIRTRAIFHGIDFPRYRDIYHTDLYYIARNKLKLHRYHLKTVCEFFDIPSKMHPMTPKLWAKIPMGDKETLLTILEHNREDVNSTDAVFDALLEHMLVGKRSV